MVNKMLSMILLCTIFSCSRAEEKVDKWIIVTTVNYPTQALKHLTTLKQWHLLVVADEKTPVDWQLDNCEFLSIEKQLSLGYEIGQLLPWNHYSRKNIGYLYAIEHGASLIYETDDDNLLKDSIAYIPEECTIDTIEGNKNTVNIYAYYRQNTVWPRGYPLEDIVSSDNFKISALPSKQIVPVQQALVDKDPDVDALFRLTRASEIFFSHRQPVSIAQGNFCPFNTQNTLFYHRAFWGLLLPISTTFRVCDIWRGYITQRLLWDSGATVCFLPASAIQERNEHNLLQDFEQELDLYLKSGKIIDFLKAWQSSELCFEQRFIDLVDALVQQGFYADQESKLVRAWIHDLKKIGYRFPSSINGTLCKV